MGPRQTYRVCGFQQLTGMAVSTALTIPTSFAGQTCKPNAVLMQADTQAVRWRPDAVAPTAAIGMILPNALTIGAPPLYYDGDLASLRFIQAVAGAVLNVTYLEDESI
jgi:hypothetical protein